MTVPRSRWWIFDFAPAGRPVYDLAHTLLFLIPQYGAAGRSGDCDRVRALVLTWLRWRFFETRFLYSFASVAFGGAIIAGVSAALGSAD